VNLEDCVSLIARAVPAPGGVWADLGCGAGAFTAALAEILGPGSEIHAVDADERALRVLRDTLPRRYPQVRFLARRADIEVHLQLPPLDGAVAANSLHYVRDPAAALAGIVSSIKSGGTLVIVEYDIDRGNPWVPYPLPFARLGEVAQRAGLAGPRLVGSRSSRYHRRMYAAALSAPGRAGG
jgi:ubiquinone/menaquinone biosynthesis C-methylase UbiE